jgi:hypothetical protein
MVSRVSTTVNLRRFSPFVWISVRLFTLSDCGGHGVAVVEV